MVEIFIKGGPIMWPILILSILTLGVVIERIIFMAIFQKNRDRKIVGKVFGLVEKNQLKEAEKAASASDDFVAKVLAEGLRHRDNSMSNALIRAAARELDRFDRGLTILDTAITLGPLLGLLGTVVGMISAFGLIGGASLVDKQDALTGGIAEALIAVAFGLGVAIVAVIPFNYLTGRLERSRRIIEDASTHLELLLSHQKTSDEPVKK